MNIINLAHGAFIMLGAYVTWQLFTSFHVDPFLSLPISFAVLFALGYLIQRYLINWVARAPVLTTFLLTFGLSLLIVNVALLIWTGDTRGVTPSYAGTNFTIDGITIPWVKLYTLAGVAGTLLSMSYALNPSMGQPFLIKAFVVCVLGGLGSVQGALVGGLAYGIVEAFASQFDRTIAGQHISGAGLQDAVALVVLLIVLIVRPTGIMGRATA
jgi:branched-chain amino acid transport system permease protein